MSQQEKQSVTTAQNKEVVMLGGGCFWCIEAIFAELEGVERMESGYSDCHLVIAPKMYSNFNVT